MHICMHNDTIHVFKYFNELMGLDSAPSEGCLSDLLIFFAFPISRDIGSNLVQSSVLIFKPAWPNDVQSSAINSGPE